MSPNRRKVSKAREVTPQAALDIRLARQTAEGWYQMLRRWQVHLVEVPAAAPGSPEASKFKVVGIGAYSSGRGPALGGMVAVRRLLAPTGGWYEEREVALAITQLAARDQIGPALDRIRHGGGPATLLREGGGWAYPRETSLLYALSALALAQHLGDRSADRYIQSVKNLLHK